jgi:beta-glucosidase
LRFGFGLSYTTFEIADLTATAIEDAITAEAAEQPTAPGGNPELWNFIYNVTISVTNTGEVDGATVPQLYVSFPDSTPAGTPPQQLRGFEKVHLTKGESQTVCFELMRRDLSYWDIISQQWIIPSGEFTLSAGFSSRDLVATTTITPVARGY